MFQNLHGPEGGSLKENEKPPKHYFRWDVLYFGGDVVEAPRMSQEPILDKATAIKEAREALRSLLVKNSYKNKPDLLAANVDEIQTDEQTEKLRLRSVWQAKGSVPDGAESNDQNWIDLEEE